MSLGSSKGAHLTAQKPSLSCLFCDAPKSETKSKNEASAHSDQDSFWICPGCEMSEQERTRALEASILLGDKSEEGKKGESETHQNEDNLDAPCGCQSCAERRDIEMEQERELQSLQKAWVQLRHAIRQMYRDGLDKEGKTGKGKEFDLDKLRDLVRKFCARDPHQLYQRLESQGHEYVMELKVNLLQILISPAKLGLSSDSSHTAQGNSGFTLEQVKFFLKSTLDNFSKFQDTVRNMHFFMQDLDRVHLEKFGITWKVVHHHLFDSVVYQDPLIENSIPAMSTLLRIDLVCSDSDGKESGGWSVDKDSLPPAAFELAQSFRALDRLMRTSRQIWEKANQRMEDYAQKQMKLYKATLKAKQKMLKEDLEFFKEQRKLLEEYVSKSKNKNSTTAHRSSEEDLTHFAETLRNLLAKGRPGRLHAASTTQCSRCLIAHCPCDECSISHVITCGLILDEDAEVLEIPGMIDEIPFLGDLDEMERSSITSGSSSDSDNDSCTDEFSVCANNLICEKRAIVRGDGETVLQTKFSALLPSKLYSLHGDHRAPAGVEQHINRAYGDWETAWDPSGRKHPSSPFPFYRKSGPFCQGLSVVHSKDDDPTTRDACRSAHKPSTPSHKTFSTSKNTQTCPNAHRKEREGLRSRSTTADQRDSGSGGGTAENNKIGSPAHQNCKARKGSSPQFPLDKLHPELVKLMKDETLAKAITVAAAKRGLVKPPANWKELEGMDWKDMNIDGDYLKQIFSQHAAQVAAESKPPGPKSNKEKTTVATQVDCVEEDDDSCSDRSSEQSLKDGKHCDCCYCEMFGYGPNDIRSGRDELPQIRERLRLKLKKKHVPREDDTDCAVRSEGVEGYRGAQPVEDLLAYIEGSKDRAGAKTVSSKALKRQRQKQKKAEEAAGKQRANASNNTRRHLTEKSRNEKGKSEESLSNVKTNASPFESLGSCGSSLSPKKPKKRSPGIEGREVIEEVFKPRDDVEQLDEVDRDVENFKKFVMDCQPSENRTKIQLNLSGMMKNRRTPLTMT